MGVVGKAAAVRHISNGPVRVTQQLERPTNPQVRLIFAECASQEAAEAAGKMHGMHANIARYCGQRRMFTLLFPDYLYRTVEPRWRISIRVPGKEEAEQLGHDIFDVGVLRAERTIYLESCRKG